MRAGSTCLIIHGRAAPGNPAVGKKDCQCLLLCNVALEATVTQVQPLANNAHNVIFTTSGQVAEVYGFYEQQMTSGGWKVTQQFARPSNAFISFQKGNMVANLTVAEDPNTPGQQVIAIMYEEQKPLEFEEF